MRRHEPRKIVTRLKRVVQRREKVEVIERAFRQISANLRTITTDDLPQPASDGTVKPRVNRWMQRALEEVENVSNDVDAVASGYLVIAMFVMQTDERPRRFVSDEAFRFQLVRMWRSQTSLSIGSTYDAKQDRTIGWYKDLPVRVVQYLAEILTTAYGPVVGYMTTLIKKDEEQHRLVLPE